MITPRFKSNNAKVAFGRRQVDFNEDGTLHLLVDAAAKRYSEIYLDAGTPPPIDMPPIDPPPPVDVPPPPPPVEPPASGTITPATFSAALAAATGGETLRLAPGNYGAMISAKVYPGPVTIESINPADPAVFSDLALTRARNIHFRAVRFKYDYVPMTNNAFRVFVMRGCEDLSFVDCEFAGDRRPEIAPKIALPASDGFCPQGCKRVLVQNCKFHTFRSGIHVEQECDDIRFIGNDIYGMRSDGMIVVSSTNVLIENNYIHDFDGEGLTDHRDCIQLWTNGALTASSNITIRKNRLHIGRGIYSQCIFIRNEEVDTGRRGADFHYKNILIEDNDLQNCQTHGISVGATDGLIVRRNSVAYVDNDHPGTVLHLARWGRTSGQIVPKINVFAGAVVEDNTFSGAPWFTGPRVT